MYALKISLSIPKTYHILKSFRAFQQVLSGFRVLINHAKPPGTKNSSSIANVTAGAKSNVVHNDILIYTFQNTDYYERIKKIVTLHCIVWTSVASVNAYLIFRSPKNVEIKEDDTITAKENGNTGNNREILWQSIAAFAFGLIVPCVMWFHVRSNVKCIIFKKDIEQVVIHTFEIFKEDRKLTVPLKEISGYKSRTTAKKYVPIKLKNHPFFFLVDLKGEFKNPKLFDLAINVKRDIVKGK